MMDITTEGRQSLSNRSTARRAIPTTGAPGAARGNDRGLPLNRHPSFSLEVGTGTEAGAAKRGQRAWPITSRAGGSAGLTIDRPDIRLHRAGASSMQMQKDATTARRNLEELVAQALIHPIFKLMDNDPLKSGLFSAGNAEKALRPVVEAQIAKSIASELDPALIDTMARRLLRTGGRISAPGPEIPASAFERSAIHG